MIKRTGELPSNIGFTSVTLFYTEGRHIQVAFPSHSSQKPRTRTILKNAVSEPEARRTSSPVRTSIPRKLATVSISTTNSEDQPRTGAIRRDFYTLKALHDGWSYAIEEMAAQAVIITQNNRYTLDDDLEWVVDARSTRRVCWLPPGYVSKIEGGHFFFSSSIIMVGQDGVVRKLTFIKPARTRDV